MVRSRLPVLSLLGLFGALLILSPELLMGNPEGFSDVPFTDLGVQEALATALKQYNQDKVDSSNYYKVHSILKAQSQVVGWIGHHLMVQLVETKCNKKAGEMTYKKIQECEELVGINQGQTCYVKMKRKLANVPLIIGV